MKKEKRLLEEYIIAKEKNIRIHAILILLIYLLINNINSFLFKYSIMTFFYPEYVFTLLAIVIIILSMYCKAKITKWVNIIFGYFLFVYATMNIGFIIVSCFLLMFDIKYIIKLELIINTIFGILIVNNSRKWEEKK